MVVLPSALIAVLVLSVGEVSTLRVDNEYSEATGHSSRIQRRSADFIGKSAYLGMMAVKNILVGAKKLPFRNRCCQEYQKTGTFREAVRDFNTVNTDYFSSFTVKGGIYTKSGVVGDKTLLVRSSGIDGKPVLEIIDEKTYNKGPLEWSLNDDPPIKRITYYNTDTN